MAYKLKPNYHFATENETGIDKVPVGRFIIVDDYGAGNIRWFRKENNTGLSPTTTIATALDNGNLVDPITDKRDVSDSYSIAEVDGALSTKADSANVYTKAETDALISDVELNTDGIIQQSNSILSDITILDNNNAMSIGPINIADGITVTLGDNSVWQII